MAGRTIIKPYKLKPSGETLTRDDLSTWKTILLGHIRQNPKWHQFLPTGNHKEWTCTDEDETNELVGEDVTATNTLRSDFQDFLTCVATYAPSGFNDTIIRESTSLSWVFDLIKTTFGLETKGENFLALDDLKFEFDGSFTYQQAFMEVKDFVCASLIKKGTKFEGKVAAANEILCPSTKNFITKEWLSKIDKRLPKHVKDTRGHLFTTDRPSLACNQKILCDQIPTMLAELDKTDNFSQGNVTVNYVPARGRGGGFTPRTNYLGRVPFRGAPVRYPQPFRGQLQPARVRPQQPGAGGCVRCLEATPRRYDAARTHVVKDCPWQRFPQQPQNNKQPNFRVVLFPEDQQVHQPQVATLAMDQQGYSFPYNQQEEQFYTHDFYNEQYYQPQEDYTTGASISELPQPDL